jgi:ribosomal protein S12 methylthiotransferase
VEALLEAAAEKRDGQLLIATGCLTERYGPELLAEIGEIDGMLGARNWSAMPSLIERLRAARLPDRLQRRQPGSSLRLMELAPPGALDLAMPPRTATGPSAYVKVSDGCDQRCAFCAIPKMKGLHRSKPPELVLREIGELVEQGVKEVVLIGQDTTRYGHDLGLADGLARLLEAICDRYPELPWVRVMYAYPKHITPGLLRVMAEREQVCKYLDVPLQHTHPEVLRRMRRPHRSVHDLVGWLRAAVPGIVLRTTFIVGFPGETEAEFEHLLRTLEELRFDRVGVFAYSTEEGTPAGAFPDQVPEAVRAERRARALALARQLARAANERLVGAELEVLIEGRSADPGPPLYVGRSRRDAPEVDGLVFVGGRAEVGQIVRVRISTALDYDLVGTASPRHDAERGSARAGTGRARTSVLQ